MAEQPRLTKWWNSPRVTRIRSRGFDPLVASVMLALGLLSLTDAVDAAHPREPDLLAIALTIVGFGALAFRSRAPLVTFGVTIGVTTLFTALEYPENGLPLASVVALYTVASLAPRRQSATAAIGTAAIVLVLTAFERQGLDAGAAFGNLALFGIGYATGRYMQVRRAYTEQLELRANETAELHRHEAERAVAEERLRVARELHDVVAHAMSVVAVQSGVAAHVIERSPDEAKKLLDGINATSVEALDEMRRMLGVLRSEGDQPSAEFAPAPSLAELNSLLKSIEGTGVTVDLAQTGDVRPLPSGLDLAAYRIVQEALTNAIKHAGPATVRLTIDYQDDVLEIVVSDDGRGAAAPFVGNGASGGGHGLIGMRERVDLYGGTLTAQPQPGGGFSVAARLPYRTGAVVA